MQTVQVTDSHLSESNIMVQHQSPENAQSLP